jgi:hypothetical protein
VILQSTFNKVRLLYEDISITTLSFRILCQYYAVRTAFSGKKIRAKFQWKSLKGLTGTPRFTESLTISKAHVVLRKKNNPKPATHILKLSRNI